MRLTDLWVHRQPPLVRCPATRTISTAGLHVPSTRPPCRSVSPRHPCGVLPLPGGWGSGPLSASSLHRHAYSVMHTAPCTRHAHRVMQSAPCTQRHAHSAMHTAPCTQHHTHSAMHTAPCTQRHAHSTMHTAPCTQHHAHSVMHTAPCTQRYAHRHKDSLSVIVGFGT